MIEGVVQSPTLVTGESRADNQLGYEAYPVERGYRAAEVWIRYLLEKRSIPAIKDKKIN
jgi:hypothetical protein